MFGPIAAAYPQHARAMLSLDMTNFAPLVLFGVLSLSFTLGVLKAANSVWGTMSESTYTLVAGLADRMDFIASADGSAVSIGKWLCFSKIGHNLTMDPFRPSPPHQLLIQLTVANPANGAVTIQTCCPAI